MEKVKSFENAMFFITLFFWGISGPAAFGQVEVIQEAELNYTYSGPPDPPSVKPRSNASNLQTLWLKTVGGLVSWTVTIPASGEYAFVVRYSNDDTGALDSVSIRLNGISIGSFETEDTGNGGAGWNNFVNSPVFTLGQLNAGSVVISLRLDEHDGFGVEFDKLTLSSNVPPPVPATPMLISPANGAANISTNPLLDWDTSIGATEYQVQLDDNINFSTPLVDISGLSGTSYPVSNLGNSTTYYWRVRASNATGDSPWSATWSFTTSAGAGGGSVTLTMDNTIGSPGETVTIAVSLNLNGNDVCAFGFDVQFDENVVSYTGFSSGDMVPGSGWFVAPTSMSSTVNISGFSQSGDSLNSTGVLVYLQFTIAPNAPAGTSILLFTGASAGNCAGLDLDTDFSDTGQIEIFPFVSLGGQVLYFNPAGSGPGTTVDGLTVYLADMNSGSLLDSTATNSQGHYQFSSVTMGGNYRIGPKAAGDPGIIGDAVNATDAFRAFAGVTHQLPFTSVFQTKIADGNHSCVVNSTDPFVIFQLATGQIPDLGQFGLPLWSQVPHSFALNQGNWCDAPAHLDLAGVSGDMQNLDFTSGVNGDVNGSGASLFFGPPPTQTPRFSPGDTVIFQAPELTTSPGDTITVPVLLQTNGDSIAAFQLELHYDSACMTLLECTKGEIIPDSGWFVSFIKNGSRIIFAGFATGNGPLSDTGVLMELKFVIPQEVEPKEVLLDMIKVSAGNFSGLDLPVLAQDGFVQITVNNTVDHLYPGFSIEQIYPNPFFTTTNIYYHLTTAQLIHLKLCDLAGRELVTLVNERKPAGAYEARFDGESLPAGVYLVYLRTGNTVQTQKLILLK